MSDSPLPNRVNIRKAVTRAARYAGTLNAQQLPRFAALLEAGEPVHAEVEFGEDEEGRTVARVGLTAPVVLECQRCLGPMATTLTSESTLGIVFDDEQASHLPARYEPWIAVEEIDLWDVAAEELALALPVVSYHADDECKAPAPSGPAQEEEGTAIPERDNPFNVLSALLNDGAEQEK